MSKEAQFYKKLNNKQVKCYLCPHQCTISSGKRGLCRVRENKDGTLYSLNYIRFVATHIDPIEKKPLFHFMPGSQAYSIAAIGCNFHCLHCQNWSISQVKDDHILGEKISPEQIIENTINAQCQSIAYTYTEPTIYYETAYDISRLAHQKGLKNIFITNGYIGTEALDRIAPFLDAVNIDLKAMNEAFYQKVCGARLQPVLNNIEHYYKLGIWLEITTLIIPDYNDNLSELKKIARFIAGISKDIPWHITAFYPSYQLSGVEQTPIEKLDKAFQIGREAGLKYVYQGNIGRREETYCPNCGQLLIERPSFYKTENKIQKGQCPYCGEKIKGIFVG